MKFSISNFKFSKLLGIAFLVAFFLFSANLVFAQCQPSDCQNGKKIDACCPTEGLVPCGTTCCPCQFCDLFVLIDKIVDFLLFKLVLSIATLMFLIGGFYLLISLGDPGSFNKAKSILTAAVIGLVIIFAAFIFIGEILHLIGLAQWTTDIYHNWWEEGFFQFPCQ